VYDVSFRKRYFFAAAGRRTRRSFIGRDRGKNRSNPVRARRQTGKRILFVKRIISNVIARRTLLRREQDVPKFDPLTSFPTISLLRGRIVARGNVLIVNYAFPVRPVYVYMSYIYRTGLIFQFGFHIRRLVFTRHHSLVERNCNYFRSTIELYK